LPSNPTQAGKVTLNTKSEKTIVGVCGLGKLGLPLALVLAKTGLQVYGVDISNERMAEIESYRTAKAPEPKVTEYLQKYSHNLKLFSNDRMLRDASIIFVITHTPSFPDGHFDISSVANVVKSIHEVNPNGLIAVCSNIGIGNMDKLHKIHERICLNPEAVALGSVIEGFENPKFVIIGAYTNEDAEIVRRIWSRVHNKPIYVVKPIEAEIIKLCINFNCSLGITFANVIGELCEKFDVDPSKILDMIYKDRRDYKSGLGFSGPCFPRDVNCFRAIGIERNAESVQKLSTILNDLNDYIIQKYVKKIKSYKKKKVGILGVSFKPNVPYVYESQPLKIAEELIKDGYQVYIYDNLAEENIKKVLDKTIFCPSMEKCLNKAEVFFIGTSNYSNVRTEKPIVNPWK
jgi:nucleotide sugar dehydrogenase